VPGRRARFRCSPTDWPPSGATQRYVGFWGRSGSARLLLVIFGLRAARNGPLCRSALSSGGRRRRARLKVRAIWTASAPSISSLGAAASIIASAAFIESSETPRLCVRGHRLWQRDGDPCLLAGANLLAHVVAAISHSIERLNAHLGSRLLRDIQHDGREPRDAAVRTKTGGTKRAEPARATKERVTFQLPVRRRGTWSSSRPVSLWRASWNRRSLPSWSGPRRREPERLIVVSKPSRNCPSKARSICLLREPFGLPPGFAMGKVD
jgi:hypothetical protein